MLLLLLPLLDFFDDEDEEDFLLEEEDMFLCWWIEVYAKLNEKLTGCALGSGFLLVVLRTVDALYVDGSRAILYVISRMDIYVWGNLADSET